MVHVLVPAGCCPRSLLNHILIVSQESVFFWETCPRVFCKGMRCIIEMKGIYTLVVGASVDLVVRTNKMSFNLPKGLYLYVGSAMGPSNQSLELRIARHLRKRKKSFWHIDYLLKMRKVLVRGVVYSQSKKKLECRLASQLETQLNGTPIVGFGCSDCRCISHLFLVTGETRLENMFKNIVKAYRTIGLAPRVLSRSRR